MNWDQAIQDFTTYLTEDYLIIFWIFTISGLKLLHATISATITFIILFIVTYFFFSFSTELFIMHFFWLLSSFSFGFLGAFLIEKSSRTIFFNKEKLEQLAVTDNLTGLYNRTKLDEVLQHELDRSKRYKLSFGLVLLDIDYFKDVNDDYGHEVGDSVLKELSEILKKHSRTTDILIRWGGEEFVPLLYEIAAYCLYNEYPIHRAFLLFGSGRNGKGKDVAFLQRWLGVAKITTSKF